VYLKGEAYFQVAKDKRPFFVDTPNGSVKEYGTSFNVNTKEGGKTIVGLVEGSVSVLTTSGKEYMMKPGEMASIQSPLNVNINKVDVEPYIAWNKGRFVFDNYTLAQVMEVLSSWYDLDVKFTSNDIKQVHYTGSIDKYGTIQPLMNAIRGVTHLNITIRNNTIYIGK
jgi:ferric-dicitrate binding protein FerR (iron transport regulator)